MTSSVSAKCQHCGKELNPSHTGPCPHCGKTGKEVIVTVNETIGLKASISVERSVLYFEFLKKEIEASFFVVLAVGFVVLATVLACSFLGGAFVALLGALISFVVGNAIGILAISLQTRHAERIAVESKAIERRDEESELWNNAVRNTYKSKAFKFALNGSAFMIVFLPFVMWFYTTQHIWALKDALDYAAIVFIAWAGLVHLSDRIFLNKPHAISICMDNGETSVNRLTEIVAKRRIGFISAFFLALGFFLEIARFIAEKV